MKKCFNCMCHEYLDSGECVCNNMQADIEGFHDAVCNNKNNTRDICKYWKDSIQEAVKSDG